MSCCFDGLVRSFIDLSLNPKDGRVVRHLNQEFFGSCNIIVIMLC